MSKTWRWRWLRTVLVAGSILCTSAFAAEKPKLTGQIFIRTQGGETIRLSLVEVALFDAKVIQNFLKAKTDAAAPVVAYFEPIERQAEEARDRANNAKDIVERATNAIESASYSGTTDVTQKVQAAIDAVAPSKTISPIFQVASEAGIQIKDDLSPLGKHLLEVENETAKAVNKANDHKFDLNLGLPDYSEDAQGEAKRAASDAVKLTVQTLQMSRIRRKVEPLICAGKSAEKHTIRFRRFTISVVYQNHCK